MNYQHTTLQKSQQEPRQKCVVEASTPLLEVVSQIDLDSTAYILVEDDQGHLIGIVETTEVIARIGAEHSVERNRWSEMPIQSMLKWKISLPATTAGTSDQQSRQIPTDCTAVGNQDGLIALVADDDLYVSWTAVKNSLSQALTDPVTSLPNRGVFDRRLQEEYRRAQREQHSLSVVLIDVDHFKQVNDEYGHSVGDLALELIADGLGKHLRSYDVLARYGGDEFAAICTACGPNEIDIPIRRMQEGMRAVFATTSVPLPNVSLSIGAVTVHQVDESHSAQELVELADMCLYRSKGNGRDCAFKMELHAAHPDLRHPVLIESTTHSTQDVKSL